MFSCSIKKSIKCDHGTAERDDLGYTAKFDAT